MKLIDQMTHEEIIALDSPAIERMVKFICATEGIKILPEPIEPVKPKHEPDLNVFRLDDWYCATREPLDKIAEVFNEYRYQLRVSAYDYNLGDYKRLTEPGYQLENMVKVEPAKVYGAQNFESVQSEARLYKEAKAQWEKDIKEWRENNKAVEAATDWVWDKYSEARQLQRQIDSWRGYWKEYLDLANGDVAVAETFMRKAYTIPDEYWEKVKS